jgi:hypothetical protein
MKAVIISDDDEVIDKLNRVLSEHGIDTIIYRWLLKALDNVEEICPDIVVISTSDYPRHWKTFAQFTKSGIGGKQPQIILFTPAVFPVTEVEKASALGITGTFASLDQNGLEYFMRLLNAKKTFSDPAVGAVHAVDSVNRPGKTHYDMIFTHPHTDAFVTGKVLSRRENEIVFMPDIPPLAAHLNPGDRIGELSFKNGTDFTYGSAEIVKAENTIVLNLVL